MVKKIVGGGACISFGGKLPVYVPLWFEIKQKHSIAHGPLHIFSAVRRIVNLSEGSQSIIKKVIQRNGYFAHPENIIIALINDASLDLRKLGWKRVMKARMNNTKKSMRKFNIPAINFNASNYYELINWNTEITEPLT